MNYPDPSKPDKLSPQNPIDHLRLLCWSLLTPSRLYAYRRAWAWEDVRMSKRIVATLNLLPLFMPTCAIGLGMLPNIESVSWPFIVLSVGLILIWLALSQAGDERGSASLAAFVVICVTVVAVMLTLENTWAIAVALVLSYCIALIVAESLAVPGMTGPFFALPIFLLVLTAQGGVVAVTVCMAALAATHVHLTTNSKEKRSWDERPLWLRLGIMGVLVGAHGFIFWFSFLG